MGRILGDQGYDYAAARSAKTTFQELLVTGVRANNFKIARFPTWSPDGTKIVFSGHRETDSTYGIFVMKAAPESETNRPKRLSGGDNPDWQPLR